MSENGNFNVAENVQCVEKEIIPGFDATKQECIANAHAQEARLKLMMHSNPNSSSVSGLPELKLDPKTNEVSLPKNTPQLAESAEQKEKEIAAWNTAITEWGTAYGQEVPTFFTGKNFVEFFAQFPPRESSGKEAKDVMQTFSAESFAEMMNTLRDPNAILDMEKKYENFWRQKGLQNEDIPSLQEIVSFVGSKTHPKVLQSTDAAMNGMGSEKKETPLSSDSSVYIDKMANALRSPNGMKQIASTDKFSALLQGDRSPESLKIILGMTEDFNGNTKIFTDNVESDVKNIQKTENSGKLQKGKRLQTDLLNSESLFQLACQKIALDLRKQMGEEIFAPYKQDKPSYHRVTRDVTMKWDGSKLEASETIGRATMQNLIIDQMVRSTAMLSFLANTMAAWTGAGNLAEFAETMVSNEYIWLSAGAMYLSFHGVVNSGLEKLGDPKKMEEIIMKETLHNAAYEMILSDIREVQLYDALQWDKGSNKVRDFWKSENKWEKEKPQKKMKEEAAYTAPQEKFLRGETIDAAVVDTHKVVAGKAQENSIILNERMDRMKTFFLSNANESIGNKEEKWKSFHFTMDDFSDEKQKNRQKVMENMENRLGKKDDILASLGTLHLLARSAKEDRSVENIVRS